jgi:predicted extracellular nuclease
MRSIIFTLAGVLSLAASSAQANIVISEWMYSGIGGEYIEFTNTGGLPVDMTGWSFDDDSGLAGTVDLSAFGIVAPGQSVILTETDAATFATDWGLLGVSIIGDNVVNLGRNDVIHIFDNTNALADRLAYGDQTFPGTIRTQEISGNPLANALGADNPALWVLASNGDSYGSYTSVGGDIGNPGVYVPEPATLCLLGATSLMLIRRRR